MPTRYSHKNQADMFLFRLIITGGLLLKLGLCNAQFVLYNSIHYPGMPSTYSYAGNTGNYAPYLKGFLLDYNASVGGSSAGTCTPNSTNIQQFATEGLKNPTWPVGFDMEINWPISGTALTDSTNNYVSAINIFKSTNSQSPISFYGLPPYPDAWKWSGVSGSTTFQNVSSSSAFVSIANAVDYFSPSLYAYSTDDTATWRKYADTNINTIRKYYSATKPIYPYIWPQWHDNNNTLMDTASWYYELNYLYSRAQGAIIWTGGTYNWDGNAAWWQTTKKFMARKGLIPPVVTDSFYVKNSSIGGNTTLRWLTSTDTVTQYFQVEKSADNVTFASASGQIAKSGGNYTMNAYEFADTSVNSTTVYYRLKSYSTTGTTRYLDTIQVAIFKSAGTSISVDLSSSSNWLKNVSGTWVSADTAPASLNNGLMYVCSNDTLKNNITTSVIGTGVTLIDSAATLSATTTIQNRGKVLFCGIAAQTIPGTANLSGSTWGTIEVNNSNGVTATQSSASNFMRVGKLTLTSGTFTVSASSGKSVSLYVDSTVTATGGNFTVTNASGSNYGPILDAKSTQSFASGTFLNNTVYVLTISNPTGFTYSGPLTVSNTLHISLGAIVNISGNVSVGGLSIDTITAMTPLQSGGNATISGPLTITKFRATPFVGQTIIVVQSANGISGNFSSVILPAGYTGFTSIQGNNSVLTITGTPNEYKSAGSGVAVDLSSATNWLVYQNGSWVAATSAPSSLDSGTVIIQSADTLNNASAAIINAGVVIIDSAITFSATNTLRNNGKIVFCGNALQTIPGAASLYGGTWGAIEVNNSNGVTSTQSSASSFMHVGKMTLTLGTFTATASAGKSVSLYLDSTITTTGGNVSITNAATNYGFFLDAKTAQSFASGTFLNNTAYSLFVQNPAGFIYNGPLTVSNNLRISLAATVNVSGNLSLNSGISLDTLTNSAPIQTGGSAAVAGILSVGKFRTVPYLGQTWTIVQSTNGISGNFSSVTLPTGYTGTTSVQGNNLILTITAAPKGYKSTGTGVSVDLSTTTNWLKYQSGSWIAATSAPSLLDSGGIVIQAGDTWNNASTITIPSTVTIVQQGNTGTFATSGNLNIYNSSLVYSGTSAQTIPSPTAFSSRAVSNLTINNAAGVTLNTGSYFNINGTLTLSSGNFVTYGGSGLYLYGPLVRTGGSINFPGIGFDGSSVQTIPDSVINNSILYINNSAGVSALSNITMNVTTLALQKGDLTLSNGDSLKISTGITYTAGGIASASSSVVAFTGTSAQSIPSGTFISNTVNNLAISNSQGVSATGNLSVQNLDVSQFNSVTPLKVTSTATVSGSLTINNIQSGVSTDTIVSAGSVNGTFSSLNLPTGYTGSLTYTPSAIILSVSQAIPLAIKNIALTGNVADNTTSLNWKVEGDNVKQFEVRRSTDGIHFTTISTVNARTNHYLDDNIAYKNYYQIKLLDNNGNVMLSNIISLNASSSNTFTVFPNPVSSGTVRIFYGVLAMNGEIRILNMNGQIVLTDRAPIGSVQRTLDVSKLSEGIYIIVLTEGDKMHKVKLAVGKRDL